MLGKLVRLALLAALAVGLLGLAAVLLGPRGAAPALPSTAPASPVSTGDTLTGSPAATLYFPRVVKTPTRATLLALQNTGSARADLEVVLYRYDGQRALRKVIRGVEPGRSAVLDPAAEVDLVGGDLSGVVRAYGAPVTGVAIDAQSTGEREASAYPAARGGSRTVHLPNVGRRYFGWKTFIAVQNVGALAGPATLRFVAPDGREAARLERMLEPGRAALFNPETEAALTDGALYAVVITSTQPVVAIESLRNADREQVDTPVSHTVRGASGGAASALAPYVAKGGAGGVSTTVLVQNLGGTASAPRLRLRPAAGGEDIVVGGPGLAPGAAWHYDIRYTGGDVNAPVCGAQAAVGCPADGMYSALIESSAPIAAAVNINARDHADGYLAITPGPRAYLPFLGRRSGGGDGWDADIVIQSAGATRARITLYRHGDGAQTTTHDIALATSGAMRLSANAIPGLRAGERYSAVVEADGPIAAVARLVIGGQGDGVASYEGARGD